MLRNASGYLLIMIIFSLNSGCSARAPSDEEAARLVKDYYLFFYSGKQVEVKIIQRGEFIKENQCYPIEFIIIPSGQQSFIKTFYFFMNKDNKVEMREFKSG
ncbi:MAG: hypothetical protein HY757_08805 [Nitrospirae bacterium]|nr:hypothetical protein [Nitrospirota bacterium]